MTPAQFESLTIVADVLTMARYGHTPTGQRARLILEDDHRKATLAVLAVLREDVGDRDALPSVAWRIAGNFGDWHRQERPDLTRCGICVPVLDAIVAYGIATTVRPVDGCKRCWPDPVAPVDYEIPAETTIDAEPA